MSLPHGVVGWSVVLIVAFLVHIHYSKAHKNMLELQESTETLCVQVGYVIKIDGAVHCTYQ